MLIGSLKYLCREGFGKRARLHKPYRGDYNKISREKEYARHFPTHMEMCMDDHFTQTTEGTQQQYLQDISHAEFPSGMENTSSFPGNQFLQGKEKNMDTGTFTIENIILNRHPALSALTHPGKVQQNFQQLKMESSNMVALQC